MNDAETALMALASQQYGVVSCRQALESGVAAGMIDRRVTSDRWSPVFPGVYRVSGSARTRRQLAMAATLWAAPDGVISHRAASSLYRFDGVRTRDVELLVPHGSGARTSVVRVRRTTTLEPVDRRVVDGIAVTSATRTIIDITGSVSPELLESAFESARRMGLTTVQHLAARFELLGGRGRAGSAAVRDLLRAHVGQPALESRLEVRAARMLRASGLPRPVRQFGVTLDDGSRFRLDFAWPRERVGLECQGFEWHGSRLRWKRDAARTSAIEASGWRLVFVTWDDVTLRPEETFERIRLAMSAAA